MVDVDGPPVVVLEGRADCHVVKAVQIQIGHSRDGCSKAGAARLVFMGAAGRVGSATGLIDRLEGEVVLKVAVLKTGSHRTRIFICQKKNPTPFNSSVRVCWYLVEFVDVDLTLLVSLGAHEHRSANQQDVSVRIPVYVNGLQDAAKIGTNLHTQKRPAVTAKELKE